MPAAASAWILLRRGIEAERMICKLGSVSLHRNDRQSRGKRSLRRRSNDCPPGSLGGLAFVWELSKPTCVVTISSGTILLSNSSLKRISGGKHERNLSETTV